MASVSRAGPGEGTTDPEDIEIIRVTETDDAYMAAGAGTLIVLMWHGNGYNREDCWMQIPEDAAADLQSYL